MMTWLTPLGFLGLIGLIVLIIIYIIKPNYQQKVISSTFVWRLSLKYRKKRLPINKLHNILLFLCQVLILTISALLLAQPVISSIQIGDENEKVIIIDASASMMVEEGGISRFERAVQHAKDVAEETVTEGGLVSVVLADADPDFLVQRMSETHLADIHVALDALLAEGSKCTYGSANMQGAVALAEEVLRYNSEAQVHLYTATTYLEKNGIVVENMSGENEWNAAILSVDAAYDENNHYNIFVDAGCYGRTEYLTVYCKVHGVNGESQREVTLNRTEFFDPTEDTKTIQFTTDDFGGVGLWSYDYLEVYVEVEDSFQEDNAFFQYGGTKQTIKIQYASSVPNNFFGGIVRSIRETMKYRWNIEFVEKKADETAATEGFDLYIFEHKMPDVMPTDGVVLLVDPGRAPNGSGLQIGAVQHVDSSSTLATGATHEVMDLVDPNRISIAKYVKILASDGYQELAYYNSEPMILVKNEVDAKVMVWAFDLNYSNLCLLPDFTFMMYNMFNYFIPSTMESNSFEIGEVVNLRARGTELTVGGNGLEQITFQDNKGQIVVTKPGTYTVTQKPMQGDQYIIENFFVNIPKLESNITKEVDALPVINVDRNVEIAFEDLLFYFAIALVAFMFAEWYLQTRKNY